MRTGSYSKSYICRLGTIICNYCDIIRLLEANGLLLRYYC